MQSLHPENYEVRNEDKFIFDTNVLIKLLPVAFKEIDEPASKYSAFLQEIMDEGAEIGILNIQISELFNVYIKKKANEFLKSRSIRVNGNNIKHIYRSSPDFETDKKFIIKEIKESLLNIFSKLNDNFIELETDKILDSIRNDYDFNDNYMYQFCEKYDFKFITHDSDYKTFNDLDITVISVLESKTI